MYGIKGTKFPQLGGEGGGTDVPNQHCDTAVVVVAVAMARI
jgi:hypothetical protein